jgi:hypothetical protein
MKISAFRLDHVPLLASSLCMARANVTSVGCRQRHSKVPALAPPPDRAARFYLDIMPSMPEYVPFPSPPTALPRGLLLPRPPRCR